MTTSEALVKYYECLRESFNKIQEKDNETALVNAALRPKICDEFEKSKEVLISYLNYVQVFSLVYSEHFTSICSNILVPLFNQYEISARPNPKLESQENRSGLEADERAVKLHEAIQNVIESKPDLADDFSHTVVKLIPKLEDETFLIFLKNCFKACLYLVGEPLTILMTKILDRLSYPKICLRDLNEQEDTSKNSENLADAYNALYDFISNLSESNLAKSINAILSSFTDNFISKEINDELKYFLLYVCSLKTEFADSIVKLLWFAFTDSNRPFLERQESIRFISSFISRANYLELEKIFDFLNSVNEWCEKFLETDHANVCYPEKTSSENIDLFHTAVHSMLYLISQRYREMYESESIAKLEQLNLEKIFSSQLMPLENCDIEIVRRFSEVVGLYHLTTSLPEISTLPTTKRRRSEIDHKSSRKWKVPFGETCSQLPERIKPLYRNYFDPRNFTINRA